MKHTSKALGALLLAFALAFGALAPVSLAAPASVITGSARFVSASQAVGLSERGVVQSVPFRYSDSWFAAPSASYNHELARMSLALQVSSWTAAGAHNVDNKNSPQLDKTGYTRAAEYVHQLYKDMGFRPLRYFHYDAPYTDESDKAAFSLAEKKAVLNGKDCVILAVTVRGGNYGAEWVSNGNVGDGPAHAAFGTASKEIVREVEKQVASYAEGVTVKLWINGYSRGGAIANLAAGALDKAIAAGELRVKKDDLFCYNFAVPLCTKDPQANSAAFGNIFNIVNPVDVIMIAPFRAWGFKRYGVEKFLAFLEPGTQFDKLDAAYARLFKGKTDTGAPFELHLVPWEQFRTLYLIDALVPAFMDSTAGLMGFQEGMQNLIRSFFVQGRLMDDIGGGDWQAVYADILGEDDPLWAPVFAACRALTLPINLPGALLGKGTTTLDPALLSMIACATARVGAVIVKRPPDLGHILRSLPGLADAIKRYRASAPEGDGDGQGFIDNIKVAHTPESYMVLLGLPEKDAFGNGEIKGLRVH